jgi:hypothetical protein
LRRDRRWGRRSPRCRQAGARVSPLLSPVPSLPPTGIWHCSSRGGSQFAGFVAAGRFVLGARAGGAIAAADFAGRRILSARDSDFFYSFTSRIIACLPLVLCRCEHYRRRCKIVAPCCGQVFPCRHCHNEATVRFCIFVPSDHGCARLAALIIRKATYLGCFNYV